MPSQSPACRGTQKIAPDQGSHQGVLLQVPELDDGCEEEVAAPKAEEPGHCYKQVDVGDLLGIVEQVH